MQKLAWDSKTKVDTHAGYVRERSADPYHSARWTKLSKAWRTSHPLCAECQRNGIVKAGECVDHITPWPVCKDFYDTANLQTLCNECNHLKGQRDKQLIQQWRRTAANSL